MIRGTRQIMREVLRGTKQNPDITAWGSEYLDALLADIDDAQSTVVNDMLTANPYMFSTYYDLTTTGALRYYLPDYLTYDYDTILSVAAISSSTGEESSTIETVWGDRFSYITAVSATTSTVWAVRDNYLEFPNALLGDTGSTYRIWYTRKPKGLWYATASGGSTTTATLTAATAGQLVKETDYYNGMKLMSAGQVRRITDTAVSSGTVTLTLDSALSAAVTNSTVIELVSPLPDHAHSLIVRRAIEWRRAVVDDPIGDIHRLAEDDTISLQAKLKRQSRQGARRVRRIPR